MFTLRDILFGILLPIVISTIVLLIAWRPMPRMRWALPAAIGVAFAAAYIALFARPAFPPADAVGWLFYLALLAAVLGAADALLRVPAAARGLVVLLLSAGAAWALLLPIVRHEWTAGASAARISAAAVVALLVWALLEHLARRDAGSVSVNLVMFLSVTFAAAVVMLSGSQKLGQIGVALAAAFAPAVAVGWRRPPLDRGGVLALIAPWMGLLLVSHFYANLTPLNAVLLLAAPLLAWGGEMMPRKLRPVVRVGLVLLPLLISFILAARASARAMSAAPY